MTSSELHQADVEQPPPTPEAKRALLERFRGPVERHDAEVVDHWCKASPTAHARAMIELCRYAEQMVAQTGLGKEPGESFPDISGLPARRSA